MGARGVMANMAQAGNIRKIIVIAYYNHTFFQGSEGPGAGPRARGSGGGGRSGKITLRNFKVKRIKNKRLRRNTRSMHWLGIAVRKVKQKLLVKKFTIIWNKSIQGQTKNRVI